MKANEAPEKLYFGEFDKGVLDIYSNRESNDEIEYTRTDAFVEKAEKWMKENFVNDQGLYCVITDYNTVKEMIADFRKYMGGK